MSRRSFLSLGAGAALLAACDPGSLVVLPEPTTGSDLTVGLLVPRTSVFPGLAVDLQAGLDRGFAAAGIDAAIVAVPIGAGASSALDAFGARVATGADVVVGVLNSLTARDLATAAGEARVPLVVTGAGANVVDPNGRHAYVGHHTLNLWQANAALGRWAAGEAGGRCWIAASAFDAGFDSLFAFESAYVAAGGTVLGRTLSHVPGADTTGMDELATAAASSGADFVFGQYSGTRAAEYVGAARSAGIGVLASAFAAEQAATTMGAAADGIVTAVTWPPGGGGPFDALGSDVAQMVAAAGDLSSGLRPTPFTGVRGASSVDLATNSIVAPVQRATVQGGVLVGGGVLDAAPPVAPGPSGLLDEYLCG